MEKGAKSPLVENHSQNLVALNENLLSFLITLWVGLTQEALPYQVLSRKLKKIGVNAKFRKHGIKLISGMESQAFEAGLVG